MDSGRLEKAIRNGQFLMTVECRPPHGSDAKQLKACAAKLGSIVHAISVHESEDSVRLCSLAACGHLAAAGAEPMLHLITRDQNRIGLQAAILGAASMGLRNILCTSGRHQALTADGTAKGVFDLDPIQLLQIADAIRKEGRLANGEPLDAPVRLVLGTDTNPFADPIELHTMTLDRASTAGADFVITRPVLNTERFSLWMRHVCTRGIHARTCIIASVTPLTSAEEIMALREKYRYLDIADGTVERLAHAQDPRTEGIRLATETIAQLRAVEGVRGIHLMTGEDFELAAEVLASSGLSET